MLISTSRKPSQKTRSFCKNLSHALDFSYANRGKMNMRDLFLKSSQLNYDSTIMVYETKGNPSKITFFSNDGNEKLAILVSVNTTNDRLNIDTNELKFKCNFQELAIFGDILSLENSFFVKNNYIRIQKVNDNDSFNSKMNKIAIINFYNRDGNKTDLQIAVKKILD
jgi:U3 small nucleolar ribonucleoprotein protein IMP4